MLRSTVVALVVASVWPAVVLAVDGVIEISQVSAQVGEIAPGDAPGFPVTLDAGGSYRLTSNLDVSGEPGAIDLVAIQITADDVSLDLNGFHIIGPAACAGVAPDIVCTPGLGLGILGTGANSWVRGGSVSGFAAGGVLLGDEARVQDLRTSGTGGAGLEVGGLSTITRAVAVGNAGDGVVAGADSVVTGVNASFNNGYGLDLDLGAGFTGSIVNENGTGPVLGGISLESNVCDALAGCMVTCTDVDGDGFATDCSPVDCNDSDVQVFPGATEVCNGVDDDCDGVVDNDDAFEENDQDCDALDGACDAEDLGSFDSGNFVVNGVARDADWFVFTVSTVGSQDVNINISTTVAGNFNVPGIFVQVPGSSDLVQAVGNPVNSPEAGTRIFIRMSPDSGVADPCNEDMSYTVTVTFGPAICPDDPFEENDQDCDALDGACDAYDLGPFDSGNFSLDGVARDADWFVFTVSTVGSQDVNISINPTVSGNFEVSGVFVQVPGSFDLVQAVGNPVNSPEAGTRIFIRMSPDSGVADPCNEDMSYTITVTFQ